MKMRRIEGYAHSSVLAAGNPLLLLATSRVGIAHQFEELTAFKISRSPPFGSMLNRAEFAFLAITDRRMVFVWLVGTFR